MPEYLGTIFASEDLTVGNTVTPLTEAVYRRTEHRHPRFALVYVEGGAIRYTKLQNKTPDNIGTPPVGVVKEANDTPIVLTSGEIKHFKAIQASIDDAVIHVEYYA